ncbi:hypothetical protein MBANPS3_003085 [Mucor bainieri]
MKHAKQIHWQYAIRPISLNPNPASLMVHISLLPAELLSAIFDTIDSSHQLTECRLVCRQWNDPAARSMFGNIITITSDKAASRLFRHLLLDSSKIPLIKHLHFELEDNDLPMNTNQLLLLAVHPNIENLTGSVKSDQFFKVLFDIVDSSPEEGFAKLDTVPSYTGPDVDFNAAVALKFKKSLICPIVPLAGQTTAATKDLLRSLDQFPKLDAVLFEGHLDGLDWMEDLLRCIPNLQGFAIRNLAIKNFLADASGMQTVWSWFHFNVQQEPAMECIVIDSPKFRPEAVLYLCYKYPNLKYFKLEGKLWMPEVRFTMNDDDVFTTLSVILHTVKKIESKVIRLVLPNTVSMLAAMKFLDKRDEDMEFSIEEIDGRNELVFTLLDEVDD